MANRTASRTPAAFLGLALVVTACAHTTRHEVLTFFFDGVPSPYDQSSAGGDSQSAPGGRVGPSLAELARANRAKVYAHAPWQKRQCRACHGDIARAGLVMSVADGLCLRCHEGLTDGIPYVHGPVTVNACLHCHHPHFSRYPGVVNLDARSLCLQCHAADDLLPGDHHAEVTSDDEGSCIDCHDPHGGSNRFFLKTLDQ